MSGGLIGGILLALAGVGISVLRKRYPESTTILIRTTLGLIIAALIVGIIFLLINGG